MSEPRKHHYLPQCYLKNFAVDEKGKQIFVVDAARKSSYISSIKDIAQRRDFNRVDFDGHDPNYIEKELAKFESDLASAIKNILNGGNFIHQTKDHILTLIALLSIRTPQMRQHFTNFHEDVVDKVMDISLSSRERWESSQAKYPIEKRVDFKEAKEFYESKKFKISVSREYLIQTEFKLVNTILPYLYERNWQLLTTDGKEEVFLTSDNPVKLEWNNPDKIPMLYRNSPGFAMQDTTIFFPLTKHNFLIGGFDKPSGYINATKDIVIASNSHTVSHSFAQVFSPSRSIHLRNQYEKPIILGSIFAA